MSATEDVLVSCTSSSGTSGDPTTLFFFPWLLWTRGTGVSSSSDVSVPRTPYRWPYWRAEEPLLGLPLFVRLTSACADSGPVSSSFLPLLFVWFWFDFFGVLIIWIVRPHPPRLLGITNSFEKDVTPRQSRLPGEGCYHRGSPGTLDWPHQQPHNALGAR